MSFRLVGRAEDRIDAVLLDSARRGGIEVAARYHRLIVAAMTAIGNPPALAGSRQAPKVPGVWALHLRSARRLVAREHRVAELRHLVVYRMAPDGAVEILSLVHDRILMARAAARPTGGKWLTRFLLQPIPSKRPDAARRETRDKPCWARSARSQNGSFIG
jgi:plasmid stabilization system protein ParE